ncbi:MAG: FliH/SctL family protein [Candidatus Eisenbacteria bacterium]
MPEAGRDNQAGHAAGARPRALHRARRSARLLRGARLVPDPVCIHPGLPLDVPSLPMRGTAGPAVRLSESQNVRAEARREGVAAGVEGERTRLAASWQALERAAEGLATERGRLLEPLRADLVALVTAVCERIVRRAVILDEEVALRAAAAALERVGRARKALLRLNPADVERLAGRLTALRARLPGETRLEWVADSGIAEGGCLVETSALKIDATIEGAITSFADALGEWARSEEPQSAVEVPGEAAASAGGAENAQEVRHAA